MFLFKLYEAFQQSEQGLQQQGQEQGQDLEHAGQDPEHVGQDPEHVVERETLRFTTELREGEVEVVLALVVEVVVVREMQMITTE